METNQGFLYNTVVLRLAPFMPGDTGKILIAQKDKQSLTIDIYYELKIRPHDHLALQTVLWLGRDIAASSLFQISD